LSGLRQVNPLRSGRNQAVHRMSTLCGFLVGSSGLLVSTLTVAVRARHSLPANLVAELTTWLDGYAGNEYEPRIRHLLNTYTRRRGSA
jgi:hypothetical protein